MEEDDAWGEKKEKKKELGVTRPGFERASYKKKNRGLKANSTSLDRKMLDAYGPASDTNIIPTDYFTTRPLGGGRGTSVEDLHTCYKLYAWYFPR